MGAALVAPAIIRPGVLMPLRGLRLLTDDVTFYVAPDGDDRNDGLAPLRPRRTMQTLLDGLDCKGRSVTIQMAKGYYRAFHLAFPADCEGTLTPSGDSVITESRITGHNKSRPMVLLRALLRGETTKLLISNSYFEIKGPTTAAAIFYADPPPNLYDMRSREDHLSLLAVNTRARPTLADEFLPALASGKPDAAPAFMA